MNVIAVSPKSFYLQEIVNYIFEKYPNDIENIRIYLPTRRSCRFMQELFIENSKEKRIILPKILPIGEIDIEQDNFEQLLIEAPELVSRLEQKVLITKIIMNKALLNESAFSFNFFQSLNLSDSLANLLEEMLSEEVDIFKLRDLRSLDQSSHWLDIVSFLEYAYVNFIEILQHENKLDYSRWQNLVINHQINNLNSSDIIFVIGSSGSKKIVRRFINKVLTLKNGYLVLPSYDASDLRDSLEENNFANYYYHIKKLIDLCEIKYDDINQLDKSSLLNNQEKIVDYYELEDEKQEAKFIADYIENLLQSGYSGSISIVTHNQELVQDIEIFLSSKDIYLDNSLGYELKNSQIFTFIRSLSKLILSKMDSLSLSYFLKHPFMINEYVFEFEKEFLRGPEIFFTDESIITKNTKMSDEAKYFISNLHKKILILYKKYNISSICAYSFTKDLIHLAEDIYPKIWLHDAADLSVSFFQEYISSCHKLGDIKRDNYVYLLDHFISGVKYRNKFGWKSKIFAINPIEMRMLKFDIVIIADMNDGSWPRIQNDDPWMNNNMRTELGLASKNSNISKSFHDFICLVNNNNVIITRAKKKSSLEVPMSRFLRQLIFQKDLILRHHNKASDVSCYFNRKYKTKSAQFVSLEYDKKPKTISATQLETLIRNPYAFFAKKILLLRKIDDLAREYNMADFGNFVHKAIDIYTKDLNSGRKSDILNIASEILKQARCNEFIYNSWMAKFVKISRDFIAFDNQRRQKNNLNIKSEINGFLDIKLGDNKNITITARADRIELMSKNIAIIDYKTGSLPSKKDIDHGLSPQLLVEGLIAAQGQGFLRGELIELIYVKLSLSSPSFETSIINFTDELLSFTQSGINKILENYLKEDFLFLPSPNKKILLKYNEYSHLEKH